MIFYFRLIPVKTNAKDFQKKEKKKQFLAHFTNFAAKDSLQNSALTSCFLFNSDYVSLCKKTLKEWIPSNTDFRRTHPRTEKD